MQSLRTIVVAFLFAGLALAAITPTAEADPICGPMSGNQIVKSRTCVRPEWAPYCAAYTEYWQYGGHYWYMCYGVGVPGNPTQWTVDDVIAIALGVVDDRLPACNNYGNHPANYRVCADPRSRECPIEVTVQVMGQGDPRCYQSPLAITP